MCLQELIRELEESGVQVRKSRDEIRKHLYWLVEELSNAQPGSDVETFREGDIVWKTYAKRVWNLKNKDAKQAGALSAAGTQHPPQKQQKKPATNYLGGLYSAPRNNTGVGSGGGHALTR